MKQVQYIICSLLFISLASARLSAQLSPHVWLGGFAGVDIGNLSVTGTDQTGVTWSTRTGFAVGAEFDDFFSDNLGICAQLAYVQKGATATFTDNSGGISVSTSSSITVSYLQIPVLLKATFGSGALKPVVFAGPEIGFKLSAKQTGKTESGADTTFTVPDSNITTINFGIMFGAGVTYAINATTMLFLNAAYDLGLSNLNAQYGKSTGISTTDTEKDVTRDIRINVGIVFGLGD